MFPINSDKTKIKQQWMAQKSLGKYQIKYQSNLKVLKKLIIARRKTHKLHNYLT